MELRPYQYEAVNQARMAISEGYKDILIVAPTGAGNTVIGSHLMNLARKKYKRSLFAAHRREIIHQTSDKLDKFDCPHGVILSGEARAPMELTQVCSIQTFNSRHIMGTHGKPGADILIYDEAHRSLAPTYQMMRSLYPNAILIGLTATPCRGDGRGLGGMYKKMIEVISIEDLIAKGFLVEPHIFAPVVPDLSQVHIKRGDYDKVELEDAMNQQTLVGNILKDWQQRASDRKTVIFASGVKHSRHICEVFKNAGVEIAHIDGKTDKTERDAILNDLETGTLQVVTNSDVLLEGWDCPPVSCAALARPTRSYGLYLQMAGRTLRPFYGKEDALLIDHAGAVYRHGFPQDAGQWSLDPDRKIQDIRAESAAKTENTKSDITCRECWHVYKDSDHCPKCGWKPTPAAKAASIQEGRLRYVKRVKTERDQRQDYWNKCYFTMLHRGNCKMAAAGAMYKREYGVWPQGLMRLPKSDDEWKMTSRKFDELYKTENRWHKEKQPDGRTAGLFGQDD